MNQNRLEIKVIKDSRSRDIDINAMSLEAARSFLTIFESLTRIVELTPDSESVKIQVTSGSAVVAAQGEKISKAKKEFDKILENKSTNKELVEQWRKIQTLFTANGLHYEAAFNEKGKITPIYDTLKQHQKLRTKPTRQKKFKPEIEFISGKLIEVGGKKPNIHVEVDGEVLPPIACTEVNASKAKAYLYQTIRFSTWATVSGSTKRFQLCDSYSTEEVYLELKSAIEELTTVGQVEALKKLHYRCRKYLDQQNYGTLRKLFRLFIHDSTDINILKTILVVTQSVCNHERL
jgi:phosphohistidine swiveling domain-containing protein